MINPKEIKIKDESAKYFSNFDIGFLVIKQCNKRIGT